MSKSGIDLEKPVMTLHDIADSDLADSGRLWKNSIEFAYRGV